MRWGHGMECEWALSLVSGLLGALIGALATLRATQQALTHQNVILQKTFQNQLDLQIAEYRLVAQLQLLRRLYELYAETAFPIYAIGHNLRNDWAGQVVSKGKGAFIGEVSAFRDQASTAIRAVAHVLEENRHQIDIYRKFQETLGFQSRFFEPIQQMLDALDKLPDQVTRDMLSLLHDHGKNFSKAIDEFSKWITDAKEMAVAMQSDLIGTRTHGTA